ncbi:hypothetical protein BDV39DRAFT_202346 [Aspergillus sergii]|uniref:Tetratricopeptide repeat protein n=1 Tax=Aspergillus sergii TaxID=1034303 RepID=A0A5N6XDF9_9EURO|nr:hypothetical protein BDV39DRAFT_202346 [Aspergillus sergii]
MDTNDFDGSRIFKELSFDLISNICKELGTVDERLYLAYAERAISRTQDGLYEEGEANLKEALRIRKALGNYIPRSGKNDRESVRTGLILYVLGNLRAVRSQWDQSFEFHYRAWDHMRATVGEKDFYTASVAHKIAEHFFRMGWSGEAISMINGALDVWSVDPTAHKNEIARSTFLKGKTFETTGKMQKASISLRVACRLRKEFTKEDRDVKSLGTKEFDEIVAFWIR